MRALILLLLLPALTVYEVNEVGELQELVERNDGSYFFLFYHSESCPACRYMWEEVFPRSDALEGLIFVSIEVYRARELTNLRYKVYEPVIVVQPEGVAYYEPRKPGEEINVGVPGTPTMVIFKAVNGTKVLRGVAIGALTPEGLAYFVEQATGGFDMTSEEPTLSLALLLTVFSAGILSVFSPCVLPVVVGTLSLTFARRNPEAIVTGMVVSFALLGALVGSLGEYMTQIQGALYLIGGLGFILVGASFLSDSIRLRLQRLSPSPGAFSKGLAYDFLLGSALGVTWLGCIAPYVGFAVITAALSGNVMRGVVVMGTYGLGMGLMLYLFTTSRDLANWVQKRLFPGMGFSRKARWEVALGVVLLLLGLLMLTELTPLKLWSRLFEGLSTSFS